MSPETIVVGEVIEAPPKDASWLNPILKPGDSFLRFCHIIGGGGWWCGPYTVLYLSGGKPAYRPKHAKVDKIASTWIASRPSHGGKET